MQSGNKGDVEQAWASLAFAADNPRSRAVLARIAKAVAQKLFPSHTNVKPDIRTVPTHASDEGDDDRRADQRESGQRAFVRAMHQINAISTAVAEGKDEKAKKFLNDLLKAQTAYSGDEDYAVKSLCNIAQQCAEMFRTDFEYECLQTAVHIKPSDAWTIIQLADHFKRVGNFDEAIKCLRELEETGDQRIARSSLADVYVHMGRFEDAFRVYEQIPDSRLDEMIRGAKADTLRLSGYLDAAAAEYQRILEDGLWTHRVDAGLAEIAKRQGRLDEAKKLYSQLLENHQLEERTKVVYKSALANVLVRRQEYKDAYRLLDEIVQRRPFARQARAYRAAVAGLLGEPEKAVRDLPQVGQSKAYNEWVNDYVRGLLLLMLHRYADARKALEQRVEERLLDRDAGGVRRLAAAVCFLRTREGIDEAANLLNNVPKLDDAFADSISAALQYHVAVALRQESAIARLRDQLRSVNDRDLVDLVSAINRRDWREAWSLEVRALLRLAA